MKIFLEDYEVDYTVVVADEDLVYRYGVIGYPTYFLIAPSGEIHAKYVGALADLDDRILRDIESRQTFPRHVIEST